MMGAVRRRGEETAARVAAGRAHGWSWRVELVERESERVVVASVRTPVGIVV
jgi:hypothetical protein